jgi:hypothetical protein
MVSTKGALTWHGCAALAATAILPLTGNWLASAFC